MPSTNLDRPSLSMASSSSSSTTASSAPSSSSSSSPSSPPSSLATIKKSYTRSSTSIKKSTSTEHKAQELLCYIGLLLILIVVWPNDRSSFPARSTTTTTTTTCSSTDATTNNGSDLCSSASAESIVAPSITDNDGADRHHHRGKVIGANVKAADLAAAYQSIKLEYESLALNNPTSDNDRDRRWQLLSSHGDGSKVHLLEHPTDPNCPYIRMTSVMPGTMQQVWDFLDLENWSTSMPKMDPFYEDLAVLGHYRHSDLRMKLARKTTSRIVAFGKRDFTFVSVSEKQRASSSSSPSPSSRDGNGNGRNSNGDSNGRWVSGTVSVVTESVPPYSGYVRAYQDSIAFYERLDDSDRGSGGDGGGGGGGRPQMKLTIVFRLDLNDSRTGGGGGYVPMWIYVKTVGATGMASVQNMKRELESMAEERERNNDDGDGDGDDDDDDDERCDDKWLKRIRNGTKKCS